MPNAATNKPSYVDKVSPYTKVFFAASNRRRKMGDDDMVNIHLQPLAKEKENCALRSEYLHDLDNIENVGHQRC